MQARAHAHIHASARNHVPHVHARAICAHSLTTQTRRQVLDAKILAAKRKLGLEVPATDDAPPGGDRADIGTSADG